MDYCDIIYHQAAKITSVGQELTALMEEIERVQYRGALAVTGAWQGTNRSKLYDELGWESLSDRRKVQRLIQMYKIVNLHTPSYLRDKLPPRSNPFAQAPHTFKEFRIRTERFRNTFFPDAIKQWNIVISDFAEMPELKIFKSHLLSFYRPDQKSIFGAHDPQGIKWLFQLRLGLSPLRHHKKRHNFLDTPTDICMCKTGVESTEHFLLKCPFYNLKRIVLAENVIPLLTSNNLAFLQNDVNLYLYGHKDLADNDNKTIILQTINFIKSSNRFD